jgi:hypothetical protein
MRMLDLFSGLGGASEAMVEAGWDVMRFENNQLLEDVPHTFIHDLMQEPLNLNTHWVQPDLIWASPPCVEFSDGYSSPKSIAQREGVKYEPDMSLVQKSVEIIKEYRPKYWVIENVRGAQPFFKPLLGNRRQRIGSVYLWGNFPLLDVGDYVHKKPEGPWSSDPLRANVRAKIPIEISRALRLACETQTTLQRWA